MNSENFLELPTNKRMVKVAKSSIAVMEEMSSGIGTRVTMKEKDKEGNNLVFEAKLPYTFLSTEINKYEKILP